MISSPGGYGSVDHLIAADIAHEAGQLLLDLRDSRLEPARPAGLSAVPVSRGVEPAREPNDRRQARCVSMGAEHDDERGRATSHRQ